MQYGICALSVVPVRESSQDASEMVTQLLYGEHFKILEKRKLWSKIRIAFDKCEGWVKNVQINEIEEYEYNEIKAVDNPKYSSDLVSFVELKNHSLLSIVLGSTLSSQILVNRKYDCQFYNEKKSKDNLIKTALSYLNTPHLWGGKSPFGIDNSGFVQMVYKINGYQLLRFSHEQATQGTALSFIEESEAGDLAFFDNQDKIINHVGIIMNDNYIIHVNGCVRIDRLDHTGIFNAELKNYTHKLRVIKKII